MSDSSDVLGDQEKELRRRNVNLASGDGSDSLINKTSNVNKGSADESDKDNFGENDTVDSDHVRTKKTKPSDLLIFSLKRRKNVMEVLLLPITNWITLPKQLQGILISYATTVWRLSSSVPNDRLHLLISHK